MEMREQEMREQEMREQLTGIILSIRNTENL